MARICLALATGLVFSTLAAAAEEPTFKTQVNLVLLDVSVRNKAGGFVSALPKQDFRVTEDGKAQPIVQFANVDIPVTVGLVVDSSGSMRSKRPDVITAALMFIRASNPLDEIFVVNFNDKVALGLPPSLPFSSDAQQLRTALWMGDSQGRTSLYDAVVEGLDHLAQGRRGRKTLIVITDGGDNASHHNFNDVLHRVEESRSTVYTVGLFDEEDPDRNPRVLEKMARVSGGFAYLPKALDDVPGVCRKIAKDIRSRYTIGYVPPDTGRAGSRHIRVDVSAPSSGKLTARTRTVYAIPSQTPPTPIPPAQTAPAQIPPSQTAEADSAAKP